MLYGIQFAFQVYAIYEVKKMKFHHINGIMEQNLHADFLFNSNKLS